MKIAVLALQGAFIEHEKKLEQLGATCIELRQKSDLDQDFDGLVLPGGESTVQGNLLKELDMFDDLQKRIQDGLPTLGAVFTSVIYVIWAIIILVTVWTSKKEFNSSQVSLAISLLSLAFSFIVYVINYNDQKAAKEQNQQITDHINNCKRSLFTDIKTILKEKESTDDLKRQISYLKKENDALRTQLEEKNRAYDKLVDKILDSQKEVCVLSKIAKKIKK